MALATAKLFVEEGAYVFITGRRQEMLDKAVKEIGKDNVTGVQGDAGNLSDLNRLFETMRGLIGADVRPTYEEPRAGDVRDSQADIEKAKRLLGYQPQVAFDEGLNKTVEWYRTSHLPVA